MAGSVSAAFGRVKRDLSRLLPEQTITEACRAVGHRWRKRLLDPVTTVQLFVLQILNFNASLTHVRRLAGDRFKLSAFYQARQRLPLSLLQLLLRSLCDAVRQGSPDGGRFCGHRVVLVDGSSAGAPDNPALQSVFPSAGASHRRPQR